MSVFKPKDIAHLNLQTLRSLAVEQSQLLTVATKMIRKLEKQIENLAQQVGDKQQGLLFTAEQLEKMRQLHFGRSSERWLSEEGTLFQLGQASEAESSVADKQDKPKKPKNHPGRKPQKKLDIQPVRHTYEQQDCDNYGLTPWEGQYEESQLITVVPHALLLRITKDKNIFVGTPKQGLTKLLQLLAL